MINNLKIKKELMRLGLTSVALVNGAISLGCSRVVEASEENIKQITSIVEAENTEVPTTPEITPIVTPTNTPSPTNTPEPTEEPSPTPYDPYTLSDEEAIEMGTYIYENYFAKWSRIAGSFVQGDYDRRYTKEDIINYVCLLNQKYPALYQDRRSSAVNGNCDDIRNMHEGIVDANITWTLSHHTNNLFPYSIFLKEGREERKLLKELEDGFRYISDNDVTDQEIYEYWGKVFKLAINSDETFKNWDAIQYYMFYTTIRSQYYFVMLCPEQFNNIPYDVPAKYVFDNNKNVKLKLEDAFYMRDTVNRSKYPGLTDQEFNAYVGCLEEYLDKCAIMTNDREYIKQKVKGSN